MPEVNVLRDLAPDDRQLLKEAVCDAVLSRTSNIVSGSAEFGRAVLGGKPSRTLSSGFILPRINDDGDDEASDIHICSHGMDLRILETTGVLEVSPEFSVYVRALPSAEELFARNGRLIPPADFNDQTRQHIRDVLKTRSKQEIPPKTPSKQRAQLRAQITREIYLSLGVEIPPAAVLPGGDDRNSDESGSDLPPSPIGPGRLRIPDRHSRRYSIPEKWIRLRVDAPVLHLPLPCDPSRWGDIAAAHKRDLIAAILAAYSGWIASSDGNVWAWRKVSPPSEAFWEPGAWDSFLANVRRTTPPNPSHLVPQFDAHVLVQPLRDPRAPAEFSIRIALENLREDDSDKECGLFGARLTVAAPRAAVGAMRLERVRRSYHLAGFMTMPGIGVNGGIEEVAGPSDSLRLSTTWMPRYVLPRQRASTIPDLDASFA